MGQCIILWFIVNLYLQIVGQGRAGRGGPGQDAANQAGPGRAGSGRVGPGWAGSGRVGPGRAGSGRVGPGREEILCGRSPPRWIGISKLNFTG